MNSESALKSVLERDFVYIRMNGILGFTVGKVMQQMSQRRTELWD